MCGFWGIRGEDKGTTNRAPAGGGTTVCTQYRVYAPAVSAPPGVAPVAPIMASTMLPWRGGRGVGGGGGGAGEESSTRMSGGLDRGLDRGLDPKRGLQMWSWLGQEKGSDGYLEGVGVGQGAALEVEVELLALGDAQQQAGREREGGERETGRRG